MLVLLLLSDLVMLILQAIHLWTAYFECTLCHSYVIMDTQNAWQLLSKTLTVGEMEACKLYYILKILSNISFILALSKNNF